MKTQEEFEVAYATLSPRLMEKVAEQARDITDAYLVMFAEPKSYSSIRHLVKSTCDSALLWMITEGFITVTAEWLATDEERVLAEAEKATRPTTPHDEMDPRRHRSDGGYA